MREHRSGGAMSALPLLAALLCFQVSMAEPVGVSVQRLGDLRVARELRAPATVLSANRTVVTSEVTALIEKIHADVGAAVKKGAILVQLDSDNARLSLEQARAILTSLDAQIVQARHRLDRALELLEKDFISDDELIGRRTDVAVLQANRQGQLVAIQAAELTLARTKIRAPFDATVVQRQAQVGNFAQPGTQLLTLVQTDRREVDVELDPRYADEIPQVTKLRYVSQGHEYPVRVLRLSNVIETDTRRVRVRLEFTDEEAPIGSSGEVVWAESTGVVPVTLIVQRGSVFGVFVAENNKAVFVEIATAQEGRPGALDMPNDTLIVSRGHIRLQDGDELAIASE